MAKMRAVQVPKAGGELEMTEREIPDPRPGTVRVKVQACGICHSDSVTVEGLLPGIQYPRVPGHEVVGVVDKVGDYSARARRSVHVDKTFKTLLKLKERISSPPAHIELCSRSTTTWTYKG